MASLTQKNIPSEIVIEITGQCNMHCTYCTQAGKRPKHLPLARIKNIIDQAEDLDIKTIRITGGEPLLAPHLAEILFYGKKKHFYIILNTNATVMTQDQLRIISKTIDNVLVSLQGYNQASTQKLTRSPGDFKEKLSNIFLLKSYVPVLRLGTVITPELISHFERYAILVERIKPAVWEIFRPMTTPASQKEPAASVYRKLAIPLLKLQKKGIRAVVGNAIPFCILKNRRTARLVFAGGRADDGHTRLVYDARGFFKPSYFINENLGTNLKKAWQSSYLRKLNNTSCLPEECQACEDLEVCCGGSRALADKTNPDVKMSVLQQ